MPGAFTDRKPDYPVDNLFIDRWSPRAFDNSSISEEKLLSILEAARWAPSSMNVQPWRFVYSLRGDEAWSGLVKSLMPGNQTWAARAAALVVIASETHAVPFGGGDKKPNRTHAFDAGAAWASIALHASMLGWATHAMGGFDPEKTANAIDLPQEYEIHAVVAVGKQGDPSQLPEALLAREAPSPRRPLSETAFPHRFPKD